MSGPNISQICLTTAVESARASTCVVHSQHDDLVSVFAEKDYAGKTLDYRATNTASHDPELFGRFSDSLKDPCYRALEFGPHARARSLVPFDRLVKFQVRHGPQFQAAAAHFLNFASRRALTTSQGMTSWRGDPLRSAAE